jgi:PAS domain S-box-containing protein
MSTGVTRYNDGELLGVPALHRDGRQISVEFSIHLVKDPEGRMEWVVAFVRDVTARYIREKALRAALQSQHGEEIP